MKKFLLLLSTAFVFSSYAYAQAVESQKAIDIPEPLYQYISSGIRYPEQFVSHLLMQIRQNGRDQHSIDQTDIDAAREKRLIEEKRRKVQSYLLYDMNFDGQVTRDEIAQTLQNNDKPNNPDLSDHLEKQISGFMKADIDGNGIISLSEMSTLDEKNSTRRTRRLDEFEDLLKLDPNKDGKLTVQELEKIARETFDKIDINKDGIASVDELKPLMKMRQANLVTRIPRENCSIPAATADEDVVFLGAYEGITLTNISVAGQEAETNIIPVTIEKGTRKIYLVTSAFSPVIWHISGDTSRISHVALAGRAMEPGTDNNDAGSSNEKINVGITGVAKEKVTFHRARDCGLGSAYEADPQRLKYTQITLKGLLGKEPALTEAQYGMSSAQIYDDKITLVERSAIPQSQQSLPHADNDAWQKQLFFIPGGIINLKKRDVVSDAPAVEYEVLPKWAGIAQLLHSGAIVSAKENDPSQEKGFAAHSTDGRTLTVRPGFKTGRDLKIVKDIPYYPSGLHGGYSVNFILGKGVKEPKGNAGHSCVRLEETGEAVQNKMACPRQN